ncbi:SAM-dependent methyltransferase [Arachidicoccus ginsenosidimutans]|uniref:class I SAM-dependent methyltransferase n=1 Tax=Arachidicoccus sp. BS20 TaxID=1850526 RepID=UPI0007F13828|nr:class I SAM-dependent methyltransferase [Arachidicoccus sp. BS20]ANI89198.1 SAM-dependent methyltransferase [Arachidicoccus sp. BS20]
MDAKFQMFENRLTKVFKHKSKLARRQNISCYRVYDHDLPEFPFSIELYGDKIYVAEYLRRHGMEDDKHELWLDECLDVISTIIEIDKEKIFVRQRKKMSHRSSGAQYEKLDTESHFFNVEESGLKFRVNLTDYLDTGLFLDHRITRGMVRDESKDLRVLNLFCYTGSFSVYAANGGALSVTSVDLSKTYLSWAEDNFNINKLRDKKKYHFVHADVKQYLKTLKPNSFDLIIMDPPTFSNSKRMKDILDIQQDHVELINDVLNAASPNGILYFSTNYTKFILDEKQIKASQIKDITKATTPFDFEGKLKRWCYKILK